MKAVFDTKPGSGYDDDIQTRYHFPDRYLDEARQAAGDWIVYRATRRGGGKIGYFAAARVARIDPDPALPGHSYERDGLNSVRRRSPRESTRVHSGVDRFDADGIRVFGPESTNPATPTPLEKHSIRRRGTAARRAQAARSGMVITWRIIMGATLHQGTSNTYYGQWTLKKTAISGPRIAVHCP